MGAFGHLLHCPLCQQLFTHPVLLPCQHSLCYGCARAQLLAAEQTDPIEEATDVKSRKLSETDFSDVTSPVLPRRWKNRTKSTHMSSADSPHASRSESSEANLSSNSEACDSPFVLSTNDCLHFEQSDHFNMHSSTPRSKICSSPHRVSTVTSHTSLLRNPPKPCLRRSNSLSSIVRSGPVLRRPNNAYATLRRSGLKKLFCPTCEDMIELGKLGISGLFRNFALESIVERFRMAAKAASAIRCGYCKPPASDATKSCLDCKLSYCNECFKIVHIWGTKKAQHGYIGPTNNFSRPKVLLCPEHSNEVNLYCNRCKKSVCRMCKLGGGSHVNHSITSAKLAYRECKERLYRDLEVLRSKANDIDTKMSYLDEAIVMLERTDADTRQYIHSSIDGMNRILEAKRSELLSKADSQMREKERNLRQEMQQFQQGFLFASISNFAEEVLKETDPSFFLQTSRMVELKIKEAIDYLTKLNQTRLEFQHESFKLDLKNVKEKLEAIDFAPNNDIDGSDRKDGFCRHEDSKVEHLHWMFNDVTDADVTLLDDARKAYIRNTSPSTLCILKGNIGFNSGERYWEVEVTSYSGRRIVVGIGNLRLDDKLHGSIHCQGGGAFLNVTSGSAWMLDEHRIGDSLPYLPGNEHYITDRKSECFSMGKHTFTVGINLRIKKDEAKVQFYDVSTDTDHQTKKLFQKVFRFQNSLSPLVAVNGEAIVALHLKKFCL